MRPYKVSEMNTTDMLFIRMKTNGNLIQGLAINNQGTTDMSIFVGANSVFSYKGSWIVGINS